MSMKFVILTNHRHKPSEFIFPLASVSRQSLGPTQPPVQWVPGVLSPGLKRGRGATLTTHPHLVPRSRMSRSYTCSPPSASVACSGTAVVLGPYCTAGQGTTLPSRIETLCYIPSAKLTSKIKAVPLRHESANGDRRHSSYSFLTSAPVGVNGQHHAPATFYPRERTPRYSLDKRLAGPQSWCGHRGLRKNPLPLPGMEPRSSRL
jgi:hypothetical protein